MSETHEESWVEEEKQSSNSKSKSFINFFRKNVDESVLVSVEKK